jgi:hypothetical protein
MVYARVHAPTPSQKQEQQGNIVMNYADAFWQKTAGTAGSGEITWAELPRRMMDNLFSIATSDLGGILIPSLYSPLSEKNASLANLVVFLLMLVVWLGVWQLCRMRLSVVEFVFLPSLLLIVIWGFQPFRFLIPFTAFLFYYLAEGLHRLTGNRLPVTPATSDKTTQPLETNWLPALLGVFLFLFFCDLAAFLVIPATPDGTRKTQFVKRFSEIESMLAWMRTSLPEDGVVTTPNPPLVHLYTDRKTVSFVEQQRNWEYWKTLNVRYLALVYGMNGVPPLTRNEKNFQVIFQQSGVLNLRVVDFGLAAHRRNWSDSTTQTFQINP